MTDERERKMATSPQENQWAKAKIDSLFFHWLSCEQGSSFIKTLTDDVKAGKPIFSPSSLGGGAVPAIGASNHESTSPSRIGRKASALSESSDSSSPSDAGASPSSRRFVQRKKSNISVVSSLSNTPTTVPQSSPTGSNIFTSNNSAQPQHSPSAAAAAAVLPRVPSFYSAPGSGKKLLSRPIEEDSLEKRLAELQEFFADQPDGISAEDLLSICKNLLQFPSALNVPLFRRIRVLNKMWRNEPISTNADAAMAAQIQAETTPRIPFNPAWLSQAEEEQLIELETGKITEPELIEFWKREVEPFDRHERFFRLIKQPSARYIRAKDFFPVVRELIDGHPGLEFLESTPEFQEKYARTVVARMMHRVNTSWTGEITSRELRRSDLLHYLGVADDEEEINAINEYFSYEHFYVIYCKFWELDQDHDFLLSKEDIFRHGGHSLTKGIVDRVFQQPCRPFTSKVKGKMGFEDFCFFILCEEDKTNATSIRYWFSLVDLDGDGLLRKWEIRMFYDEQLKRMKSLGHEEVLLEDVFAQMKDCLGRVTGRSILFASGDDDNERQQEHDEEGWVIGLSEFLRPDRLVISGTFFNLLFNLNKFVASEARDPFTSRMMAGDQPLTDWDRFALTEYSRLASAEEARGSSHTNANSNLNFSADELAARMVNGGGGGADSDDDDDDEEEEEEEESGESSGEDSGSFNTKGLRASSPLFTSTTNVYRRTGMVEEEEEEDFSDDDELESCSEDGMEPVSAISPPGRKRTLSGGKIQHVIPTEEAWTKPEARYNVATFWMM